MLNKAAESKPINHVLNDACKYTQISQIKKSISPPGPNGKKKNKAKSSKKGHNLKTQSCRAKLPLKAHSHLPQRSADSAVDCINAEIGIFLSLRSIATVCRRRTRKMQ